MKLTRTDIAKAKTLAELEALAKRNGYAFGWAQRVFAARIKKNAALLCLLALTACNGDAMAKCEAAGYSYDTCHKQLNN